MRNAVLQADPVTRMPGTSADQVRRPVDDGMRDDADVRRDVLRALMLDSLVPLTVDAQVRDGIVTLTGTVSWHGERDDAMLLAASVRGVLGILDEVALVPAQGPYSGGLDDDAAGAKGSSQ
jgi:osmotically-inducible protein OsmY